MMMRLDTERMLAEHLMNLATHEKEIERERMVLNEHYRFQPHSAFKRVDRLNNKRVNSYDIATFLRDNGYNYYSVELGDLIRANDADNDGHLDFNEFTKLFVTGTDPVLQRRAFDRYEEYVGFRDRLAFQVESGMVQIIIKEVEGLKQLNREKEMLKNRYDFSRMDAFRAIDSYRLNSILRDDLRQFLNRNGIEATALDLDHLFKRLDLDNDGRITYSEFCDYIERVGINIGVQQNAQAIQHNDQGMQRVKSEGRMLQTPQKQQQQKFDELSFNKNQRLAHTDFKQKREDEVIDGQSERTEIEKNYLIYGIRERNATPLKKSRSSTPNATSPASKKTKINHNSQLQNSEDRFASMMTTPSPTKGQNHESPNNTGQSMNFSPSTHKKSLVAKQLNLDDIEEEEKENQDSQNYIDQSEEQVNQQNNSVENKESTDVLPPLERNEEENLAEVLKNFIFIELDIEKSKQQLALKADFNLLDAFRLFDKYGQGEITKNDLVDSCQKLGLYAFNKRELDLFFKRYDTNSDYKLRFLEFSEAFTPQDKIYADHLSNKRPNYDAKYPDEALSLRTRLEFGDTLRMLLKCELYAEDMRSTLGQLPRFTISAAFQTIDINNNGYLTKSELKCFLEDHEFFATQKEIDLLFAKMNRDRDEKISYEEFFTEIATKLPC